MANRLNVLIVGGYGTFGSRIVELLENDHHLILAVAGRSLKKASGFCHTRRDAKAKLVPVAFDRNGDLPAQIAAFRPDILVDASGPFQGYGADRYRLIEACIKQGVNYLDLADGSDFVAGVHAYDDAARDAGLYVLSGVSSFPVLTALVIRHLSSDMAQVRAIRGGVAPSPYAGVGENVIRATAGYAGQPIFLRHDGKNAIGYPYTEHIRYTIVPPGRLPLRNRMFSLVDVPDLRALIKLWPEVGGVWMGAGPVPAILHRALVALAWLVRFRLLPSASVLAPLIYFATNHLRWGEHRGGMFVEVEGVDKSGVSLMRSWHLLAEGNDGPLIPSMAVAALVQKTLEGHASPPGARTAVNDIELGDYEKLFASRRICTGIRTDQPTFTGPLYARILGTAWDQLPVEIRRMHDVDGAASVEGRASVERGDSPLARLAAFIMRFPKAAADTPVRVEFEVSGETETWTRRFGDDVFSSRQFGGRGHSAGLVCEGFGPLLFAMALVVENARLSLVLRRWSAFGIPLPMWLCPRSDAFETVENGRFRFHVEISHPICGLIVRYKGWLEPDQQRVADAAGRSIAPLA
jgi:hypothetical protein